MFDQRVSVTNSLAEGGYVQCHACRRALSEADVRSDLYLEGISCPYCHDKLSATQKASFCERRRQVLLAAERGELHVGAAMPDASASRRSNGGRR